MKIKDDGKEEEEEDLEGLVVCCRCWCWSDQEASKLF
jgi:hypothetical protein